ncbi:MAG: hypothetical protein H6767_08215 [Candidatus Peribacteria bacterium]|nr:MAG: hypothetical protein H6767_08215 [Candidatus Peribacteria bacterium]
MKPLRFFVSITLTIGLSYGVIQAWTGLTASEGDTLDYTIWNELVDKVSLITST